MASDKWVLNDKVYTGLYKLYKERTLLLREIDNMDMPDDRVLMTLEFIDYKLNFLLTLVG
jgi:hypothetical protein